MRSGKTVKFGIGGIGATKFRVFNEEPRLLRLVGRVVFESNVLI